MSKSNRPDPLDQIAERLLDRCRLAPRMTAAEQAAHDAKRREAERELAEFRRKYPALAAREDAMFARMEAEIRQRVFGTAETR